jgi:hypothetical protein
LTSSSCNNFAGLCFTETLGGSFVSLNFWHVINLINLLLGGNSSAKSITHFSNWNLGAVGNSEGG